MNNYTQEAVERISAFENHYHYDASYLKAVLRISPEAMQAFEAFQTMGRFRGELRSEVYFVAALAAMQTEDCGPCVQLNVKMALESGVRPEVIRGVLSRDGSLPSKLEEVRQFAVAVATNQVPEDLLNSVRKTLGERALVELALCIASVRVYPCLKRALGYAGASCERLGWEEVLEEPLPLS